MLCLYHAYPSVTSAKVRLVLHEKSLDWEGHVVDVHGGEQFTSEYRKLNRNSVIPTLVHNGRPVIESSVIVQYLDEAFPSPRLMPSDPISRAQTRLWLKKIDDLHISCATLSFAMVFRQSRLERSQDEIATHFDAMPDPIMRERQKSSVLHGTEAPHFAEALQQYDRLLGEMEQTLSASAFLAGPAYSLADAAATPYVNRAAMLGMDFLWSNESLARPHVSDWFGRMRNRPSFEEAVENLFTAQQLQMFATAREQHAKFLHALMEARN